MKSTPALTLSVVSHGQNALVNRLLADVRAVCTLPLEVVVTLNAPDPETISSEGFDDALRIVRNSGPRGFGANHNAAFAYCRAPCFCVCNPDIRLRCDPFPHLLRVLADPAVGAAGPLVRAPDGRIEDSARHFPTPTTLLGKLFSGPRAPDYAVDQGILDVDWVAGMFQSFRSDAFVRVKGFDESYFLYYEDVDICARLWQSGKRVAFEPAVEVVHDARRASRRDFRLALHHLASGARFLARRYRRAGTYRTA